jgi:SpoVK/Ycf46/Vps4 family AAA+-type ATPase
VIYGPPGTGKTEVAKIMGLIFSQLGILSKGVFKKVTRADLVAGYLGQTAMKTRDVIKECLGGCLFIDEAYSLGSKDKKDSFSKECIDTLCEALSDHKGELMVIVAGYETELNECFFAYNQGLDSRFIWRFHTDAYDAKDLSRIFCKKVKDAEWKIDDQVSQDMQIAWFEKNRDCFKFHGRDMETLLTKVKIEHSKRVFSRPAEEKRVIRQEDLHRGFEKFLKNDACKKAKEETEKRVLLSTMYI